MADTAAGSWYAEILRENYLPYVVEGMRYPDDLMGMIEIGTPRQQSGKFSVFAVHTRRGAGRGSMGDDGYLPDPGNDAWDQFRIGKRHYAFRTKFEEIPQLVSRNAASAWFQVTAEQMRLDMKHAKADQERILHHDGSGIFCLTSAVTNTSGASWTIDVTLPTFESSAACTTAPTIHLYPEQYVALVNTSTGNIIATGYITSVTDSNTFVMTVTAGTPTTSLAVCNATRDTLAVGAATDIGSTSYKREMMGIAGIITDQDSSAYHESELASSWQGVPSSAGDFNQAYVEENGGTLRSLTGSLLNSVYSKCRLLNGGKWEPSALLTTYGVHNAYHDLLDATREYQTGLSGTQSADGAIVELAYRRKPIIPMEYCWGNRLYLPDLTDLAVLELGPWSWMDRDGSIFYRMPDKRAYAATMTVDHNLMSMVRKRHAIITDLAEVA